MNLEEFYKAYEIFSQKQKITINCSVCGTPNTINKEKAEANIKKHGNYIDRACVMKAHYKENPKTEETKLKNRLGRLGKKQSVETKKAISDAKIAFYKTEKGKEHKKLLSKKAVSEHGSNKINKSKRKVLYISVKNNSIRVCNSSYEYVACEDFWEKDPNIKSYETQLEFNVKGRDHSLDVLITWMDDSKTLVEIKPLKRVNEFAEQILDCKKYAELMGYKFELWTESNLNIRHLKEARNRADEYCKTHYLIDYAAYRQQKDRDRANRHYDNKISKDKVIIYCEFCKNYHSLLKISYSKNVSNNGRFICIKENGSIVGKLPKKKKENPYEQLGMKQCKGVCARVLPFNCFSKGKAICKECRSEIYKNKYQEKTKMEVTFNSLVGEMSNLKDMGDIKFNISKRMVFFECPNKDVMNLLHSIAKFVEHSNKVKVGITQSDGIHAIKFDGSEIEDGMMSFASSVDAAACDVPQLFK